MQPPSAREAVAPPWVAKAGTHPRDQRAPSQPQPHAPQVMGYGLNYGYAIEGAVGTNIKIDCSYLSPNVNLAARLEAATKRYPQAG